MPVTKKWFFTGPEGSSPALGVSETPEGDQLVISIERHGSYPNIETIRFGRKEWDALRDLHYDIHLLDTPRSDAFDE